MSRRSVLGATAGVLGGGAAWYVTRDRAPWPSLDGSPGATTDEPAASGTDAAAAGEPFQSIVNAAPLEDRTLVLIELQGGNDGLSTLVPYGDGRLADLRHNVAIDPEELIVIDDQFGVNPNLAAMHDQGVAYLQGVGVPDPGGSHFGMEQRWWAGAAEGNALPHTGFLGRVCDQLDVGAPVTGVSLGGGNTPALISAKAVTLGLPDRDAGWYLTNEDPWFRSLRTGWVGLAAESPDDGTSAKAARRGLRTAIDFADVISGITEVEVPRYEDSGDIGESLAVASVLLGADLGVRVIHVPIGGFDTHSDQRGTHDNLLRQISNAVAGFRTDLADLGLGDSTLIATTSEFGRRPEQNDNGTDHGSASVAMLAGPVVPGLHGETPSLTDLDDDDNLVATVSMGEYYATLAAWFDIPATEVLDVANAPLTDLLR